MRYFFYQKSFLGFALAIVLLAPLPSMAQKLTTLGGDCTKLSKIKQADLDALPKDEVLTCLAKGGDAPWQFRPNLNEMNTTGKFDTLPTFKCDPSGVCRNSTGSRTAASALPAGYQPHNNPNLTIPEVPWKDANKSAMPCGAIGGLSELAAQTLWGNVGIKMPSDVKSLVNAGLKSLLGKLFGKKLDCQDGTLWGTLNNLLNIILPKLGVKGGGSFAFDRSNNTFLAPPNTFLALPHKAVFVVDVSGGTNTNFTLPVGGKFTDVNGQKITLNPNTSVQFMQDGSVVTSDGGQYKVKTSAPIELDPNGVVTIPTGSVIPVNPDTTLFPMGPVTRPPEWAKNPESK